MKMTEKTKKRAGSETLAIETDAITKVLLIILAVVVSYLISLLLLRTIFVPEPESMFEMMRHMMRFNESATVQISLVALSLALIVGLVVSLVLTGKPRAQVSKLREVDELEIIKKTLSEDERAIIEEIRRAGEITQDSLRFRLGWSKSKVSRILTILDKMNIIQRQRIGKTYNVFLTGKRAKQ